MGSGVQIIWKKILYCPLWILGCYCHTPHKQRHHTHCWLWDKSQDVTVGLHTDKDMIHTVRFVTGPRMLLSDFTQTKTQCTHCPLWDKSQGVTVGLRTKMSQFTHCPLRDNSERVRRPKLVLPAPSFSISSLWMSPCNSVCLQGWQRTVLGKNKNKQK